MPSSRPRAAPQRQYGGNYSIYAAPGWDHFDPHRANFAHPFLVFNDTMGRLIQVDDNRGPILAADIASLPEIPDDETYIFSFDQGARFWDRYPTEGGRMFTAEDAASTSIGRSPASTPTASPTRCSGAPRSTRRRRRSTYPTSRRWC